MIPSTCGPPWSRSSTTAVQGAKDAAAVGRPERDQGRARVRARRCGARARCSRCSPARCPRASAGRSRRRSRRPAARCRPRAITRSRRRPWRSSPLGEEDRETATPRARQRRARRCRRPPRSSSSLGESAARAAAQAEAIEAALPAQLRWDAVVDGHRGDLRRGARARATPASARSSGSTPGAAAARSWSTSSSWSSQHAGPRMSAIHARDRGDHRSCSAPRST